ncbi:MAG: heparinase II/III domain-containing protein [Planctomycetota bacterium]|jgi:hypothetical protein
MPLETSRSLLALVLLAAALPGTARAGTPSARPKYLTELGELTGKHPHDLIRPERLGEFRANFAKRYPDLAAGFRKLEKDFDAELMPAPRRHRSKPEFVKTMQEIRRFCGRMTRFAEAYLATGDRRYGEQARRMLLHLARWDANAGGGLKGCDEVPMSIMQLCPRVYDWTYDLLTPEERKLVRESMRKRGELMLAHVGGGRKLPTSSHPGRMLGFLGEAGVVFYGEFPEAEKWLTLMEVLIRTKYPNWGSDDGGWAEGPQYWGWYTGYMIPFIASLDNVGGADAILAKPFFRNNMYYGIYCAPLTLNHSPFGDAASYSINSTHNWAHVGKSRCASFYGRDQGNGHFLWYASQLPAKKIFFQALFESGARKREPVALRAPDDLPQSRHFRDIGWAAMHSSIARPDEDVFMLFKSSPYGSTSHSHSDQNGFAFFAYGKPLAICSGYYDYYNSAHHRGWNRRTKANNCILVDGQGQPERGGKGRIESFLTDGTGDGLGYARGDARLCYSGKLTRALRHCVKLDSRTYVLVDDLAAPKAAKFSWLLHAVREIQVSHKGRGAKLRVTNGPAILDVQLGASVDVAASQSNKFSPPPVRKGQPAARGKLRPDQWHATVTTQKAEKSCAFIARLTAGSERAPLDAVSSEKLLAAPESIGAFWKRGARHFLIVAGRGAKPAALAAEGVAASGRLAFVGGDGTVIDRWLLVEGTKLKAASGEMLVRSPANVTVSVSLRNDKTIAVGIGAAKKGTDISVHLPTGAKTGDAKFRGHREKEWKDLAVRVEGSTLTFAHPGVPGELVLGAK